MLVVVVHTCMGDAAPPVAGEQVYAGAAVDTALQLKEDPGYAYFRLSAVQ
jgi:hypothetical protein